jgi:putative ABC transport system permease protein
MNFFEAIRVAWIALTTHKMRALLTTLGIVIGVGSVIGMQAIGTGFQQYMAGEFDRMGAGVIYITPAFNSEETDTPIVPRLTAADAEAMAAPGAVPAIARVAVEYNDSGVVSAGRERFFYRVNGVTPTFFVINSHELGIGRFFGADEERTQARVAVIGRDVATELYGGPQTALGQRVTINGVGFEVIGVLATRPNQMGGGGPGGFSDPTKEIYLPFQTARSRLFRNNIDARVDVSRITAQAVSPDKADEALRQITVFLRERHRLTYQNNDFEAQSVEQTAEQAQQSMVAFSAFLLVIGGISLLVGGIGIMNIMLVSVTQRTREIGLRKAVGARRRDIMLQFLIEAVVLSLIGGTLGVGLGYLLSFVGTFVMEAVFLAPGSRAVVTTQSILMATGVSALIGIVFGFFPALRAAGLQPVRALRSE